MGLNNLSSRIIYGAISGLVYATVIAILDYYNAKAFDLIKFILGTIIFGIVMLIIVRIKNRNKK